MNEAGADDALLVHRDRFPILARSNYLISNSLGAVPVDVRDELNAFYETWAGRGVRAWEEGWWTLVADVGHLLAPLIGAGPGDVVFQPNVTIAHEIVLSALSYDEGRDRIVTDAMHFPSILHLIEQQTARGAVPIVVPSLDGIGVDLDRICAAINGATVCVAVSHVLFKSAFVHDVAAIAARCRDVGALLVVDGYQAAGILPVDVRALGVDVYIGGCLKWLCGGPGNAFLYVAPEHRSRLRPRLTGWQAHVAPFAFEPELKRRDDMWRFLTGTPSIPSLYTARPGLRIIAEAGIERIRQKSRRQTARLIELAAERGWRTTAPADPERRGGTVAIDVPNGPATALALKAREVVCDYRPGAGIRLSPHFYNRDDELDAAVEAIAEIQDRGDWRDFADCRPTVT